ncbi:unnamed protein product, partial [Ectocarpus sp. 4 AP-2014]
PERTQEKRTTSAERFLHNQEASKAEKGCAGNTPSRAFLSHVGTLRTVLVLEQSIVESQSVRRNGQRGKISETAEQGHNFRGKLTEGWSVAMNSRRFCTP